MKRKILAVLIAALVLFVWNAISWMALPFHGNALNTIPDEVITEMNEGMPGKAGVYHYPGEDTEDVMEKLQSGPRVSLMVYRPGSTDFFDPMIFATSLLYNIVLAFLVLQVILRIKQRNTKSIVVLGVMLGLIVGFSSDIPQMNWYLFPFNYTIINVIDYIVGITIISLLINKLVKNDALKG